MLFILSFSDEIYCQIYKEIFKDENYSYIKEKTKESIINNLKNLIIILSKNLEMDLKYIDAEAIINKKDKKNVKYLLVLFINILKIKELAKQNLINKHLNNQIEHKEIKCLTEIQITNKNKNNEDKSFDNINKMKNKYNNIYELLKKRKIEYNDINNQKYEILASQIINDRDSIGGNKKISENKRNFNYFLSKEEFINEIIKIIKSIIPKNKFNDFLINDSFNEKISKIIENIYCLHFQIYNNLLISKQFLLDYIIDIKYIILKNLFIHDKSFESEKNLNNSENIAKFSKMLKNKKKMKKYYSLNYNKRMREDKINKFEYEYERKKSYKAINEYCKLYPKLIQIKKAIDLENLELQELLFKLKYYQSLEQKESIVNNLKKNNNKAKISINKLIKK